MKPLLALILLAFCAPAAAQMTGTEPLQLPKRTYDAFVADAVATSPFRTPEAAFRKDSIRSDWEALHAPDLSASRFSYLSDGHRITGFLLQPRNTTGKRPVLIWARGGVGNVSQDEGQLAQMAGWVRRGYIVIGSNYRGSAGSEGSDEFSGRDVNDIRALMPIVRQLPAADADSVFGIGFSRGGTMLYRAVAEGLPLKAFVTAGGVTDLADAARQRPDLGERFKAMMPDYAAEAASGFCARSAVCWPERMNAPLLLANGGADTVVPPRQAVRLGSLLEQAKRPYRVAIIGQADHGFTGYRTQLFDLAETFFREHGATPAPLTP